MMNIVLKFETKYLRTLVFFTNSVLFCQRNIYFMLYNSLILPYSNYCNIVWTGVGTAKLNPIHKLQKKALRICTNSPFCAPSRPLFHRLNTLNVFDIRTFQIALLMFKCVKHIARLHLRISLLGLFVMILSIIIIHAQKNNFIIVTHKITKF